MRTSIRTSIRHITPLSASIILLACQPSESEFDAADSVDLRGGATITLAAGTSIDADELESREGYGSTLVDTTDTPWFVRVEHTNPDTLEALGLEPFEWGSGRVHLGILESDGGEDCGVYMPFSADGFVVASRPAGEFGCPETLDEIGEWLPTVEASEEFSLFRAFGDVVGTFNGITAYSNGSTNTNSGVYSTVGLTWQCVEYVNRYFYQYYAHKNLKGTGNANTYFSTAAAKDLDAYTNGVSTAAPAVGDMLVSSGGTYGHIAIVREVGANYVNVIHQNWSNTASDNSKQLTLSVSAGKYTVGTFSASYAVQGWLRRKPVCSPTVSSVSPTTATLNQSKQFTGSGSCLSTTTTAPFIPECINLVINSRSATQVVFTCTPSYSTGVKAGVIKHAPDGKVVKNFSVTVN